MWIDTFGAKASGTSGGAAGSRRGGRPKAMAAISSMRASAMATSGTSSTIAQPQRKGGAGHEVMALPEGDDRGEPGADHIGGGRKRQRLRALSRR